MPVQSVSCTPNALLNTFPCLQCYSKTELKQVLVMLLAELSESYEMPGSTNQVMKDSACFTCLSEKQLLQAMVSTLAQQVGWESTDFNDIKDKIKCLNCANPKQIDAAITYLVCLNTTVITQAPG